MCYGYITVYSTRALNLADTIPKCQKWQYAFAAYMEFTSKNVKLTYVQKCGDAQNSHRGKVCRIRYKKDTHKV